VTLIWVTMLTITVAMDSKNVVVVHFLLMLQ